MERVKKGLAVQDDTDLAFFTATDVGLRGRTARSGSGQAMNRSHRVFADVRHGLDRTPVDPESGCSDVPPDLVTTRRNGNRLDLASWLTGVRLRGRLWFGSRNTRYHQVDAGLVSQHQIVRLEYLPNDIRRITRVRLCDDGHVLRDIRIAVCKGVALCPELVNDLGDRSADHARGLGRGGGRGQHEQSNEQSA